MKKIESLTDAQWAQMREWRERAYRLGSSTEPCDRPRFERAVTAMYGELQKPAPKFVWCPGPMTAIVLPVLIRNLLDKAAPAAKKKNAKLRDQLGDQLRGQLRDQLWDQLWGQLRDQLWDQLGGQLWGQLWDQLWGQLRDQLWDQLGGQLWGQLRGQLRDQLRDQLSKAFWGGHELYWIAYTAFGPQVGVRYTEEQSRRLQMWLDVGEAGHWWWPLEGVVIASERPKACQVNEERRLHRVDGPALEYADGTAVHAFSGVRVPPEWTQPGKLTKEVILKEANAERRRVAIEVYGRAKFLRETAKELIDADVDERSDARALILDREERKWMVCTDGSTGRVYPMRVPNEVQTCAQAYEALTGLESSKCVGEG